MNFYLEGNENVVYEQNVWEIKYEDGYEKYCPRDSLKLDEPSIQTINCLENYTEEQLLNESKKNLLEILV